MSKTPSERSLIHTLFSITASVSGPTVAARLPAPALIRDTSLSSRQVVMSASRRRISAIAASNVAWSAAASCASSVKAARTRCVPMALPSTVTRSGARVGGGEGTGGDGTSGGDGAGGGDADEASAGTS